MSLELVNFNKLPRCLCLETLAWRNSPEVASYFKIPHIDEDTHQRWVDSLHDPNPLSVAFMIMKDGRGAGVTYFHSIDYAQRSADWGIYIRDPALRGQGIGSFSLEQSINYARGGGERLEGYLS